MADFIKRLTSWGLIGAIVGLVATLISKYYPEGGILNLKLASPIELDVLSRLRQGLDTSLGEKLFGYFNGVLPIEGNVWLWAAVTGAIVVVAGRYLLDYIPFFKPKTTTQKLAIVLFYGTVVMALLTKTMTVGLNLTFASVLGTLLVYYIIVALVSVLVLNIMGKGLPAD